MELMGEKKKVMPTVWFSLKKSLHCKSESSDVYNPKTRKQLSAILTRKSGRSGCSRSIANLKDVIHGSKRHLKKPPSCSPRSIGSSEFLNPITHEVILSNSTCELKITGFGGFNEGGLHGGGGGGGDNGGTGSEFLGTLRPGTPGPGGHYFNPSYKNPATPHRKTSLLEGIGNGNSANFGGTNGFPLKPKASLDKDTNGPSIICHKCGEQFGKWEALESHHLSKHAGKELLNSSSFFLVSYFITTLINFWTIVAYIGFSSLTFILHISCKKHLSGFGNASIIIVIIGFSFLRPRNTQNWQVQNHEIFVFPLLFILFWQGKSSCTSGNFLLTHCLPPIYFLLFV